LVNPPWAQWLLTNGSEGEEPPDAVKRLYEVHQAFVAEPDPQKRFELESEMYAIHNENLWLIGTVKQPADLAASWYNVVSSRMYNITYPVAPEWYYSVPATWAVRDE
jgi:peptide/nickel transport system substrate-binding protein